MKREILLEKGYTEEQVTELLDMFHKNNENLTKQNQQLTADLDAANNKIVGLTKIESDYQELKQSQLTNEEKDALAKQETQRLLEEAKTKTLEASRVLNESKVRVILSEIGGIDENVLKTLVTDDEATSIANANALLNQIKTIRDETINKTKQDLATLDVKPNASNVSQNGGAMDWTTFSALSAEEQVKFQEEHPDEFAKL